MSTLARTFALLCTLASARAVLADPSQPEKPKPPATATDASARKAAWRQARDEHEKSVRERGEVFAKITTKHDYSGEYILFRDQDVTAFLDLKDPAHPRFTPGHDDPK